MGGRGIRSPASPLATRIQHLERERGRTDWRKLRADLGLEEVAKADAGAGADATAASRSGEESPARSRAVWAASLLALLGAAALLVRARRRKG